MDEQKPWQHGYDLEYLKQIETSYLTYNSYAVSPFSKYKKNDIARDLKDGTLMLGAGFSCVIKPVKVASDIDMYQGVTIGRKLPGDVVITKLVGTYEGIDTCFNGIQGSNVWTYVWAEDNEWKSVLKHNGFSYIGGKVTTHGEIYSIWFRDAISKSLFESDKRPHMAFDPVEMISIKKIADVSKTLLEHAVYSVRNMELSFANHYSNYNKDKSWSAISLRGYSSDVKFIENPSAMSKKWQLQHQNEIYFLQDTNLFQDFYWIKNYLNETFSTAPLHRVRFMKLQPGGGELERHTDQVDNEIGANIGDIARFHIPIITNPDMVFTSWTPQGEMIKANMQVGELWYLDIRKPHKAINNGNEPRIHLVVDVMVTEKVKDLINATG